MPSSQLRRLDIYPDLLNVHRVNPERYPFLLESVADGQAGAHFDILFAYPGSTLELRCDGKLYDADFNIEGNDFLAHFDAAWCKEKYPADISEVPFHGGWFVYLGYELAGQIESRLKLPCAASTLPTALAVRIPAAVVRDHAQGCIWLLAERGYENLLAIMEDDVTACVSDKPQIDFPCKVIIHEEESEKYLRSIASAKRYIEAGDVYQINLSRAWEATLAPDAHYADIYRRLRTTNPSPYAGLAVMNEQVVISSSPERLVRVQGNTIETRPIAGTRPRGTGANSDLALSQELLAHPKERAEHIMLIDLERNDLGRLCTAGSVHVNEFMVLESYAHVHHIVSNVRGQLLPDMLPGQILRAIFPGGTITGCPKIRCMQIIAELEGVGRGAYCGSMGYINRDGSMDFNILIRTLIYRKGHLSLRTGAGIVADSVPERELEETRAKSGGLLPTK